MKQIEELGVAALPIDAKKEFFHEVYDLTEACELVKTQMPRAYVPWNSAYSTFTQIYGIALGTVELTKPLREIYSQRNTELAAVDAIIRAAKKSDDPEVRAAAESLEQTRVSFPVNPEKGYLTVSGQLDTYLKVMLGPQLENVTKVGALPFMQQLNMLNEKMHEQVKERDEERRERIDDPTRTEACNEAVKAWHWLRTYVNAYSIIYDNPEQPNTQLNNYIDSSNVIVRRYKSIYLGGAGNKPNGGQGEGEGSTGEGEGSTGSGTGSGSGSGSGGQTSNKFLVTWIGPNGETFHTQEFTVGEQIVDPEPPAGYIWNYHPNYMPAENLTVDCLLDE